MRDKKAFFYLESFSEATTACLIAMVQGNIFALGLSHLLIASQTGLVAGVLATSTILIARIQSKWIISLVLGVITTIADYLVHPGMMFEWALGEALATGVCAGVLSYAVGKLLEYLKKRNAKRDEDSS